MGCCGKTFKYNFSDCIALSKSWVSHFMDKTQAKKKKKKQKPPYNLFSYLKSWFNKQEKYYILNKFVKTRTNTWLWSSGSSQTVMPTHQLVLWVQFQVSRESYNESQTVNWRFHYTEWIDVDFVTVCGGMVWGGFF